MSRQHEQNEVLDMDRTFSNGAMLNGLPMDVLGQLTREEGPACTAQRMAELAGPAGQRPG